MSLRVVARVSTAGSDIASLVSLRTRKESSGIRRSRTRKGLYQVTFTRTPIDPLSGNQGFTGDEPFAREVMVSKVEDVADGAWVDSSRESCLRVERGDFDEGFWWFPDTDPARDVLAPTLGLDLEEGPWSPESACAAGTTQIQHARRPNSTDLMRRNSEKRYDLLINGS